MSNTQKTLALSLSGGGARAFCYAGVIKALSQEKIPISYLIAHSGAALMLCYLFSGKKEAQVIRLYSRFSLWKFTSFFPRSNQGFISTKRLINYLNRISGYKDINELPIPTTILTTDITDYDHPKKTFHQKGNLAEIAVASSTIPPLFPLYYTPDGKILVDGGFSSVYSAGYLRKHADVVIGCYPDGLRYTHLPSFFEGPARLLKSLNSARGVFELQEEPPDLEIKNFPVDAGLNDYKKAPQMLKAGFDRTIQLMPQIKKLL